MNINQSKLHKRSTTSRYMQLQKGGSNSPRGHKEETAITPSYEAQQFDLNIKTRVMSLLFASMQSLHSRAVIK